MKKLVSVLIILFVFLSCKKNPDIFPIQGYLGNYKARFKFNSVLNGSYDGGGYVVIMKDTTDRVVLVVGPLAPSELVLTPIFENDGSFNFTVKNFNSSLGGTDKDIGSGAGKLTGSNLTMNMQLVGKTLAVTAVKQ